MEKLLGISAVCILFSITGKAQDLYLKNDKRKYSFIRKDSVETMNIKTGEEGSTRLDLYKDSLYAYHAYAVIDRTGNFSAGTWKIVNDSLLVLQSDKRLFEKVFNRNERQMAIKKYRFMDFDPEMMMIIYPDKAIYPVRKIINQ